MFGLGWAEVLVILAIAAVLLGNKLPALGRWLGRTLLDVKKGVGEVQDEFTGVKK